MWRSLFLSLAIAAAGRAQDAAGAVEIRSTRDTVLVARTLALSASAFTDFGRPIDDFTPRWRSASPEIATVDDGGVVTGIAPGLCAIEAFDALSGISDRIVLRVYPSRIEITPVSVILDAGAQQTLRARVLDANGAAIPGVPVVWRSGLPGVASVDATGSLRGVAEGATTVAALLDAGSPSYQFSAQVPVRVRRRPDFLTQRIVASDQETSGLTLTAIGGGSSFSGSGDTTAFLGSLSNGSRALFVYRNGALRRLATAGEYMDGAGAVIQNFVTVSANSAGDVLARIQFGICDDAWTLFHDGQPQILVRGCGYPDGALGERGEFVYIGPGQKNPTLNLRQGDGSTQVLVKDGDSLPGLGSFYLNLPSMTPASHVIFGACSNGGACGEYLWNGAKVEKLVAQGDSLTGLRIDYFSAAVETSSGDIFVHVSGPQEQRLLRRNGGAWSTLVANNGSPAPGANGAWCSWNLAARGDALLFGACTSSGTSLFRWQQDQFARIAAVDNPCEFHLTTQGAAVYRQCSGLAVKRVSPTDTADVAASGAAVSGTAATSIAWTALAVGGSGSNPIAPSADALVQFGTRVDTIVKPGQSMPGGATLSGVRFAAGNGAGDLVFQADVADPKANAALYLWRGGKSTLLADNSGLYVTNRGESVNGFACCFQPLGLNHRNQVVAWEFSNSGNALALFSDGLRSAQVVVNMDGPGGVGFVNGAALDEGGRVMYWVFGSGVFLWDNGKVTKPLTFGAVDSTGVRLDFFNNLVAAGDRFYAIGYYQTGPGRLLEYSGGSWRALDTASVGVLSGNKNGDLTIITQNGGVYRLIVRRTDGTEKVVASTTDPISGNEWLLDILSATIDDTGAVYFTGRTPAGAKERLNLFRAVPQ